MYELIITVILIANGASAHTSSAGTFVSYELCEQAAANHKKAISDVRRGNTAGNGTVFVATSCALRGR